MMEQYTKANITGTVEPLNANLKLLNTLYDGWVQAVEKLKKEESTEKKVG
jgi:flagellar protein FliS